MRAMFPEAASSSLPPRLKLIAALGNGGTPKLRRGGHIEFAAHGAMAHRSSEIVSTSDGCRGRAPRIETAQCDDISDFDAPLLLQLMRHNVRAERAAHRRIVLAVYRSRLRSSEVLCMGDDLNDLMSLDLAALGRPLHLSLLRRPRAH